MFKQVRSISALLLMTGFMLSTVVLLQGCGSDSPAANDATPELPDTAVATDQLAASPESGDATKVPETSTSAVGVTGTPGPTPVPNTPTAETSAPPPAPSETATPAVSVVPEPVPEGPTPLPIKEVESDQPILRPFREVGQAIDHPLYTGGFLIGYEHYVYFQNDGLAGQVKSPPRSPTLRVLPRSQPIH